MGNSRIVGVCLALALAGCTAEGGEAGAGSGETNVESMPAPAPIPTVVNEGGGEVPCDKPVIAVPYAPATVKVLTDETLVYSDENPEPVWCSYFGDNLQAQGWTHFQVTSDRGGVVVKQQNTGLDYPLFFSLAEETWQPFGENVGMVCAQNQSGFSAHIVVKVGK